MSREGESEELASSSLPCDGQGKHDLKKQSSDKEKKTREKDRRFKGRIRCREDQWKILRESVENGDQQIYIKEDP